jgi:hypothetical protein
LFRDRNVRSLVHFVQPAIPSGCAVGGATPRLNSAFAATGRTLHALWAAAAWTELGVTGSNQPATTGAVTSHVVTMYTGANDAFVSA